MGDDDLKYRIKVEGDISDAKKVEDALGRIKAAAKDLNKEKLLSLGEKAAEYASVAAAVELLSKSIEEYAEKQERVASLDAALAARAQLNDGYRISLQKLAAQQQELTGIPESGWLQVLTTLTQAGAAPQDINTLTEATKNLAGVLGGDLQSAAFAIGKALNGEFAAFTRIGIAIDDNATQAQKLDQLWTQLAQRGGGQLEARTETLKGSFAKLKNATVDLLSGLGSAFAAIVPVQGIITKTASAINWLASLFTSTVPKAGALKNAIVATGAAMETQEEIAKRLAKQQEAIALATSNAASEIDRETASLKANTDEANRVADAQAQLELKKIDIDEKSGRLTPTEAAAKRSKINKKSEQDNFKRESDARAKEIAMLETQTAQFVGQGDEANQRAMDERSKLDDLIRLKAERGKLAKRGESRVQIAQNIYDSSKGAERTAAGVSLSNAKYDRDYSLHSFDQEHGTLNEGAQAEKAKQEEDRARETNVKIIGPQVRAYRARIQALQDQQRDELKRHGFVDSANRLDQYAALKEAREKERGEVKVGADGSLEGSRAAIRVQQASDALKKALPKFEPGSPGSNPRYAPGTPDYQRAVQQRDAEIARLRTFIDGILRMPNILERQQNQMRAAFDRIDVLEAQLRNNPNR